MTTSPDNSYIFDAARPPWDVSDRDRYVRTTRDAMDSPDMRIRLAGANAYMMSVGHMLHSVEVEDKIKRLDGGKPTDIIGQTGDLQAEIAALIGPRPVKRLEVVLTQESIDVRQTEVHPARPVPGASQEHDRPADGPTDR